MVAESLKARDEPAIPGYRIEGVVGRGATGIVYRARQLSVDRVVALKVLHKELVGAKSAERRLQREARTTARLAHPNIISAIDMGEVDGMWWYAMELVDGESLYERLKAKPLSEREALRLFIPLCDALQHAFERGVVHRDIKPANILIERGGRALLVDMGLAFAEDDPLLTKGGGTLGTPHYISPEQARDPSGADTQSDIWSLGATLYHAVCGRPPFKGESVAEILSAVLYEKVPDPAQLAPQLSSGFVLVLRKCLTRDRKKRYATPADLMADLERLRERRAPRVKRRALEPVERDWTRTRASWIAGLGLLALVIGTWMVVQPGRDAHLAAEPPVSGPSADPLELLAQAAVGDAAHLTQAWSQAMRLQSTGALIPESLPRLEDLKGQIYNRLETELWNFKREAEKRFARTLAERDFDVAEVLAGRGLRQELSAIIGSQPLPDRMNKELSLWTAKLESEVVEARTRAEQSFATALDRFYVEKILPRVDDLQSKGQWRDARSLLANEAGTWIADSKIPTQGLSETSKARVLSDLRSKLTERRDVLDNAWRELDQEIKAWVVARVAGLRADLDSRKVQDAASLLRADWEIALEEKKLAVDRMPLGLPHLAHEELEKSAKALAGEEKKLADDDAQGAFDELEQETRELWKSRRYGEVERTFEGQLSDTWRQSVVALIELRAREARLLERFLAGVAQEVRSRNGQTVDLRFSTITVQGKLVAGVDPLEKGFRLVQPGGRERLLALRGPPSGEMPSYTLLSADAIEQLSRPGDDPESHLALALFRFREDDPLGAQAALNQGPLPPDDPLRRDLEARLAGPLAELKTAESERVTRAEDRLHLLRREMGSSGGLDSKQRHIEELLSSYSDVLKPEDLADVRRWRDDLAASAKPATEADFTSAFQLPQSSILKVDKYPGRIRLVFDFRSRDTGIFEKGTWSPDGTGWSATAFARSDEDMLEKKSPALALRDPLRVQADPIDVRLKIEQLANSPPDLVLLSIAGFHVALTGAREGRPARCLIDTSEPSEIVKRAREGGGKEFAGLKSGTTYDLRIVVNRARGWALLEIDGKKIAEAQRPAPRGEASSATVTIRSYEPVRLVEALIESARR